MEEFVPYLITVRHIKEEFKQFSKIYLNNDEVSIGRGPENTITVPNSQLSARHCVIKKSFNHWILNDTSHLGILVNNRIIVRNKGHVLKEGDLIQLDFQGDFIYKVIMKDDDFSPPRLRRKLDEIYWIDNLKVKFEESQKNAIEHLERKIQNTKQLQTNSIILKEHLEINMAQKMQQLKDRFKEQIENLKGEKHETEKQKLSLEEERDKQLSHLKQEMGDKIAELKHKIEKHNEDQSELMIENNALKDKMVVEREQFLSELNRQSTSKQNLLEQLTANIKEREEIRLKEKQEFEAQLKCQVDYFKATDNELQNRIETVQKLELEQLLQAQQGAEKEMVDANKSELKLNTLSTAEGAEEIKENKNSDTAAKPDPKLLKIHKENTLKVFGELLETELQCSICSELFMKSTTLNCSHTFCEYCINKWAMQRNECPVCRSVITSKCRSLALDTFIDKMVLNLTDEMKTKRGQMLKDRQSLEVDSIRRKSNRRGADAEADEEDSLSSISSYETVHETSDSEYEQASMSILLSSVEVVPGIPGARYGGYGRCHKCRQFGHWAVGCPF